MCVDQGENLVTSFTQNLGKSVIST